MMDRTSGSERDEEEEEEERERERRGEHVDLHFIPI